MTGRRWLPLLWPPFLWLPLGGCRRWLRSVVVPVVLSAPFVQLLNPTIGQVAAHSHPTGLRAGSGGVRLVLAG
ncbi:hypothetical protein GCM10010361_13530 [Streptomyces olivaceiscleroticus]|uniref:Uncharacterized protein n=1 Tax=Streptomyces olivaceiscleroticus TaxID=68245 RepID=A0ABN0ZL00_9ACTN